MTGIFLTQEGKQEIEAKIAEEEEIHQALKMEKEQLMDACQQGFYDGLDMAKTKKSKFKSAEQYYNETMRNVHLITKEQEGADVLHQYLYITSDEEIKEGDWVITNNGLLAKVITELTWHFINSKKIILTTDSDLIKNGVQAIDDEFLEWFVKNPSCIFIPQEEPEISDEAKKRAKNYMALKGALEVKEETLEKAAKKYAESNQYDLEYYDEGGYQGIEVESFAEKLVDFTTKWQAERMYSEEEVLELLRKAHFVEQNIEEWFEQHKKK